jgi:hypothetical protein
MAEARLTRTFAVTDQAKEESMHALPFDSSSVHARLHMDDLRREAAQRRRVQRSKRHAGRHHNRSPMRLQRAPAA